MLSNWEKKWETFAMTFAREASNRSQHEWSKHYSSICILTSNIVLSCVVLHLIEFKMKTKEFDIKTFKKKLSNYQQKEVRSFIKYLTLDFIILLMERKEIRDLLLEHNITDEDFEAELFHCLDFNQQERIMYYKFKPVSGTLEHSVHLIKLLGAESESKNEGLLLGIEYFKKNFFDNLKKHLIKLLK
ncbi:hypothetical protein CN918_32130 [Priestia megaterium]|nr:hypothetical protein CN918_32130 [Priestia megaterium]